MIEQGETYSDNCGDRWFVVGKAINPDFWILQKSNGPSLSACYKTGDFQNDDPFTGRRLLHKKQVPLDGAGLKQLILDRVLLSGKNTKSLYSVLHYNASEETITLAGVSTPVGAMAVMDYYERVDGQPLYKEE